MLQIIISGGLAMTTEQNNKPERGEVNPAEAAWLMFEKTGKLSYYLLYKKLK